eukprot:gnl/Trimastix_PCT/1070.p1 GENE.gnl/Trimastix_PCT/1070~~gnl/Trimastix_PCT/1070.p1  ORF type:complete len:1049 (+),score=241.37 gnl/Trimastix_PCT/1070:53-3148(+)
MDADTQAQPSAPSHNEQDNEALVRSIKMGFFTRSPDTSADSSAPTTRGRRTADSSARGDENQERTERSAHSMTRSYSGGSRRSWSTGPPHGDTHQTRQRPDYQSRTKKPLVFHYLVPSTFVPRSSFPPYYTNRPHGEMDQLRSLVTSQIEYYFSDENLVRDHYLREQMNSQGWVSIRVLGAFNRLRFLTNDYDFILTSLSSGSQQLEVNETYIRRRNDWESWIIPVGTVSATEQSEPPHPRAHLAHPHARPQAPRPYARPHRMNFQPHGNGHENGHGNVIRHTWSAQQNGDKSQEKETESTTAPPPSELPGSSPPLLPTPHSPPPPLLSLPSSPPLQPIPHAHTHPRPQRERPAWEAAPTQSQKPKPAAQQQQAKTAGPKAPKFENTEEFPSLSGGSATTPVSAKGAAKPKVSPWLMAARKARGEAVNEEKKTFASEVAACYAHMRQQEAAREEASATEVPQQPAQPKAKTQAQPETTPAAASVEAEGAPEAETDAWLPAPVKSRKKTRGHRTPSTSPVQHETQTQTQQGEGPAGSTRIECGSAPRGVEDREREGTLMTQFEMDEDLAEAADLQLNLEASLSASSAGRQTQSARESRRGGSAPWDDSEAALVQQEEEEDDRILDGGRLSRRRSVAGRFQELANTPPYHHRTLDFENEDLADVQEEPHEPEHELEHEPEPGHGLGGGDEAGLALLPEEGGEGRKVEAGEAEGTEGTETGAQGGVQPEETEEKGEELSPEDAWLQGGPSYDMQFPMDEDPFPEDEANSTSTDPAESIESYDDIRVDDMARLVIVTPKFTSHHGGGRSRSYSKKHMRNEITSIIREGLYLYEGDEEMDEGLMEDEEEEELSPPLSPPMHPYPPSAIPDGGVWADAPQSDMPEAPTSTSTTSSPAAVSPSAATSTSAPLPVPPSSPVPCPATPGKRVHYAPQEQSFSKDVGWLFGRTPPSEQTALPTEQTSPLCTPPRPKASPLSPPPRQAASPVTAAPAQPVTTADQAVVSAIPLSDVDLQPLGEEPAAATTTEAVAAAGGGGP